MRIFKKNCNPKNMLYTFIFFKCKMYSDVKKTSALVRFSFYICLWFTQSIVLMDPRKQLKILNIIFKNIEYAILSKILKIYGFDSVLHGTDNEYYKCRKHLQNVFFGNLNCCINKCRDGVPLSSLK